MEQAPRRRVDRDAAVEPVTRDRGAHRGRDRGDDPPLVAQDVVLLVLAQHGLRRRDTVALSAVRRGDQDLRDQLEQVIEQRRADIDRILEDYKVPRVEGGNGV